MEGHFDEYLASSNDPDREQTFSRRRTGTQGAEAGRQQGWKDLLGKNRLGIIDNPVRYRNREDLENDIETFYETHKLKDHVDLETLKRGARLAHNSRMFVKRGDCTSAEERALEREENPRFLELPRELQVILMTCCIGAIVQGWSQTNITGANLLWPDELHLNMTVERHSDGFKKGDGTTWPDVWAFAGVQGVAYFAAGLIGAWLSDPLNEYFTGRRGALFFAGLFSLGASIGSAFVKDWKQLFVCRLLQGVGMGAKASVVPIFESEVAPSRIRGRMLVSWQTFTAFGIFLGAGANLIVHDSWRLQLASGFIPCVPLLCLVFVCSESPRWLIKRSRYADAFRSLCRLRETNLQAARDLYTIHTQIQVETLLISDEPDLEEAFQHWTASSDHTRYQDAVRKTNFFVRTVQLFTIARNRRASLAAGVAMASQQLSGLNIFAFLSASFMESVVNEGEREYSNVECLWYSLGFATANTIFSPIAFWYIDTKGRRFLLLWSLVAMVPALLATGFSFKIPDETGRDAAIGLFIVVLTAVYSPGAGVVPFLYSSEVFPLVHREVGMSLSCGITFILAGVVATGTLPLLIKIGPEKLLGLFAGLDAFGAILVWLFLPGTSEATSLEEMNYVFGVPTRKHVSYQLTTVLRWSVREYIPWMIKHSNPWRGRDADVDSEPPTLDPLYIWERDKQLRKELEEEKKQEWETQRMESEVNRENPRDRVLNRDVSAPQLPPPSLPPPRAGITSDNDISFVSASAGNAMNG